MNPLVITVLISLSSILAVSAPTLSEEVVEERLRTRLEVGGLPLELFVGEEPVLATSALPRFYARRLFVPAWTDDQGPTVLARELLDTVTAAESEGLRPEDYHRGAIEELFGEASLSGRTLDAGLAVDLELLLSDAFLLYASHMIAGRVDPTSFDAEWHVSPALRGDVVSALEGALQRGHIRRALEELRPKHAAYHHLLRARKRYRDLAIRGPFPTISSGGKLERGVENERVAELRARLLAVGDLDASSPADNASTFDEPLHDAVLRFQRRHGLRVDGVVGQATLEAINVPVEQRLRQIELSLERWRWLPEELGRRHILVNIPAFELDVVAENETVMVMNVVVGKPFRRTPVFSAEMTYLVLSPYWHVPQSIAVQDILPELKKDPGYLARKNMKVFEGWGGDTKLIDPGTIDWASVGRRPFPYRFRQEPGPLNALGGVKFMFPNPHNVYLHDTPSRELFQRPDRTFSSGCIRIEKPLELAEYLLASDERWSRRRILEAIEKGVEQTVRLPAPITVHLQYWTSWVDVEGTVHFRNDVYGRDELLVNALAQRRIERYQDASAVVRRGVAPME